MHVQLVVLGVEFLAVVRSHGGFFEKTGLDDFARGVLQTLLHVVVLPGAVQLEHQTLAPPRRAVRFRVALRRGAREHRRVLLRQRHGRARDLLPELARRGGLGGFVLDDDVGASGQELVDGRLRRRRRAEGREQRSGRRDCERDARRRSTRRPSYRAGRHGGLVAVRSCTLGNRRGRRQTAFRAVLGRLEERAFGRAVRRAGVEKLLERRFRDGVVVTVHRVWCCFRFIHRVPRHLETQRLASALDALAERVHARSGEPKLSRRVVRPRHVRLRCGRFCFGVVALGHLRVPPLRVLRPSVRSLVLFFGATLKPPALHHRGRHAGQRRAERENKRVRLYVFVRAQRRRRVFNLVRREGEDQSALGVFGLDERLRRRHRERHGGGGKQRVGREGLGRLAALLGRLRDWKRHGLQR
mmetsp:Transcript_5074/g.21581  ORF Transcript_5074/g.21581 Transcript_5074/m.21581 type:complete len:413 (+) Transcript_5074:1895-3133(+)